MKKNISLNRGLLLVFVTPAVLCMDELNQSAIIPTPTKQGLGFTSWIKDKAYGEEENLYYSLQDGSFDPGNISCHHKLATAIEAYSKNKQNDQRLTQTLELVAVQHKDAVKLDQLPARMAHSYLSKINKDKQSELKDQLSKRTRTNAEEMNNDIAALKAFVQKSISDLEEKYNRNHEDTKNFIDTKCTDIRRVKKGLMHTHQITLHASKVLKADDECSDDEINPENVSNSYSNSVILGKIGMEQPIEKRKENTCDTLRALKSINNRLQEVAPISLQ
jgi:hypothetical protein